MTTPVTAEQFFYEGNRLREASDFSAAELHFRQALALNPRFAEAWANLGNIQSIQSKFSDAEASLRRAIVLRASLEEAQLMLGVLLMNQKRFVEAEHAYREYLRLAPNSAPAWSNLGVLFACQKREAEAEQCYRHALSLDANFKKASFNLSYILLRQERWEEGWRCLEYRWQYEQLDSHFECPRWKGESLNGKSLMIAFEAGHGDMIFYVRYVSLLKQLGARRVSLICHPGLTQLFKTLAGVDELFSFNDMVPKSGWDYWSPPMSLPYFCQTRPDTIPAPIPYLAAEPDKVDFWQARLAQFSPELPADGLKVGIVWRGSALFENDADRSIDSLEVLRPLTQVPNIQLISLQKGAGEGEALQPPAGFDLLALGGELQDFSDTAALITCLDLVISVDTAVAHLTGALGKPCWVLLPDYRTDWRWHSDRADSPWYPQRMRLYRQSAAGNWSAVLDQVARDLNELVLQSIQPIN